MKGTVASNLACPQGVKGGRDASSIPPTMGTPSTFLSGNCIHTPDRSWGRGGAASLVFAASDVLLFWAIVIRKKVSSTPKTAKKRTKRIVRISRREPERTPEQSAVRCPGKVVRNFMGFSFPVSCPQAQRRRGNAKYQNHTPQKNYTPTLQGTIGLQFAPIKSLSWPGNENLTVGRLKALAAARTLEFRELTSRDSPNGQFRT